MEIEKNIKTSDRENWLDVIRVFACVSVLIFHVINGYMKDSANYSQMYWPWYMNALWLILKTYQVPAFFCISGYLYQKYSAGKFEQMSNNWFSNFGLFELKKVISLLIPYIVFSVLYVLLSSFIDKEMHTSYGIKSLLSIYKEPVAQYWYLLSLMWIFVFAPFLSVLLKKQVLIQWILVLAISLVFSLEIYPLSKMFPQFVYFALGFVVARYLDSNICKRILIYRICGVALFVLMATGLLFINNKQEYIREALINRINIIFSIGMVLSLFLFFYNMNNAFTKTIGKMAKYSLHIYLIHTWITGIIRVGLRKIGVYNNLIHMVLGVVIGLSLSLLVSIIIKKIKVINFLFEPQLYISIKKKGK